MCVCVSEKEKGYTADLWILWLPQIHVRIAGVDAPEAAHFGKPAQPYSAEALEWLRRYLVGRRVRARVWRRDQYGRVVATVTVARWGGLVRRDVGLAMLRAGVATTYEAKTGVEFGGREAEYRKAEAWAKRWRKGLWGGSKAEFESPRAYKTRMAGGEGGTGGRESGDGVG